MMSDAPFELRRELMVLRRVTSAPARVPGPAALAAIPSVPRHRDARQQSEAPSGCHGLTTSSDRNNFETSRCLTSDSGSLTSWMTMSPLRRDRFDNAVEQLVALMHDVGLVVRPLNHRDERAPALQDAADRDVGDRHAARAFAAAAG